MNTSCKQPIREHSISFAQIIQCTRDIQDILNSLSEKFEEYIQFYQQKYWMQFWSDRGEHLILNKWYEKYGDYIIDEEDQNRTVEQTTDNHNNIELKNLWNNLWYEHQKQIYEQEYYIFQEIFHQYCFDLKNSLQLSHDISEDELLYTPDYKELQLLGLPRCFGSKNSPSPNPKRNTMESSTQSPSDSEKEEEEDMPKESVETLPNLHESNRSNAVQAETSAKSRKKKKRKKRSNREFRNAPEFMIKERNFLKYWRRRFSLFSRFDEGIRMDKESWFSVTPEKIAFHLAKRLTCDIIIDGFCGCGGNAIQFAFFCQKVIAIDIDVAKLNMAKHNASIYGVAHKIDFILGDYVALASSGSLNADIVFLSPPWGGPQYKKRRSYNIETSLLPISASELLNISRNITENVAIFLPRNSNFQQMIKLAGPGNRCEIEHNYLNGHLIGLTGLYGDLIIKET